MLPPRTKNTFPGIVSRLSGKHLERAPVAASLLRLFSRGLDGIHLMRRHARHFQESFPVPTPRPGIPGRLGRVASPLESLPLSAPTQPPSSPRLFSRWTGNSSPAPPPRCCPDNPAG